MQHLSNSERRRKHALPIAAALIALFATSTVAFKSPSPPPESPVDKYQRSWEHKALGLQSALQIDSPLARTTFLHSHNTYNSSEYRTAVRYLDPNHEHTIKDQLRMDIRAIEFDVHWYFSMDGWPWEWGKRPLLCHGQSNHLGCSSYDRHLKEGMSELNSFIRGNRGEVVILYIEDHLDGRQNDALNVIKSYVGDLIYRPAMINASSTCMDVPTTISKRTVLNAGKNIILWTGGCKGGEWGRWVFRKDRNVPESNVASFKNYPNCTRSRSEYDTKLIRYYEDRTNLTDWFGGGSGKTTTQNVPEMMKCGVNLPGYDKINPTDGRLAAAVWSWDRSEPNDWGGREDCAHQWGNGRWNDNRCEVNYRFACKNAAGEWYVTNASGQWHMGHHYCSSETGGAFSFAVPIDGYDNQKLLEAKQAKGVSDAWIRYHDRNQEGTWQQ